MVIYFSKLKTFLDQKAFKHEYQYQNSAFKKFIDDENNVYYKALNVELAGGEEGRWIEVQLPDNEEPAPMDRMTTMVGGGLK